MRKPSEIKINEYTLEEILERHLHWLNKDCEGWENMRADLRNANLRDVDLCNAILYNAILYNANLRNVDLSYANLCNADLCNADLCYADLRNANLCNANLYISDLRNANLRNANLHNVDLSDANLCNVDLCDTNLRNAKLYNANLRNADLRNANLCDANLRNANLRNANLCDAKHIPFIPLACPSDGAFIAWKKVDGYLIKLEIPEDAKRCSATTEKCRASKAKVLGIYTLDGIKTNLKNVSNTNKRKLPALDYIAGETVYPDSFDEDRWNECSHGIHFFVNKQDAINY